MKIICNIPWTVHQAGGRELVLVGDPATAARHIMQFRPELEIIACGSWSAQHNKSTFIVRERPLRS